MPIPITDQLALAELLRDALLADCPDSQVLLRGSLATGTADEYSDVDLAWIVPDEDIGRCVTRLPAVLSPVAPVVSVRSDPDFQRSRWRRLIFVRFGGLPLFWRLDLEIRAASRSDDERVDLDNSAARGTDWSLPESAAMNAIATIKALRRGRADDAESLLSRGFDRIAVADPHGPWRQRIIALAAGAAEREPRLTELSAEIRAYLGGWT